VARSVRFTKRAEANFLALPDPARALVAKQIVALAEADDPTVLDVPVLVAPAGENSGRLMSIVLYGRYFVLTIFRIKSATNELRVLAVERVFGE
jgi:hypothetical protein